MTAPDDIARCHLCSDSTHEPGPGWKCTACGKLSSICDACSAKTPIGTLRRLNTPRCTTGPRTSFGYPPCCGICAAGKLPGYINAPLGWAVSTPCALPKSS